MRCTAAHLHQSGKDIGDSTVSKMSVGICIRYWTWIVGFVTIHVLRTIHEKEVFKCSWFAHKVAFLVRIGRHSQQWRLSGLLYMVEVEHGLN